MSFNGTGTFTQATAPVVAGTVISSTNYNTQNTDFVNGLSNVICKDGQTTVTANLPMATYRHTGVGNAVARTDYAATGQVQDGSFTWCGTAGGTKNALTLTPSPAITALATGSKFRFKAGATQSDDAVTIAVSGLTAKAAEINDAALSASVYIEANKYYEILYDGTAFQLSRVSAPTTVAATQLTGGTLNAGVGYSATPYNAGTKSSGTYTPAASDGNFQYAVNGGAHTLAPPGTDCTIVVQYTNNSSAGAITTSGFTKVIGTFTTTDGDDFMCAITRCNSLSLLVITALQ
jgi:hypothetical protein